MSMRYLKSGQISPSTKNLWSRRSRQIKLPKENKDGSTMDCRATRRRVMTLQRSLCCFPTLPRVRFGKILWSRSLHKLRGGHIIKKFSRWPPPNFSRLWVLQRRLYIFGGEGKSVRSRQLDNRSSQRHLKPLSILKKLFLHPASAAGSFFVC